MEYSCKYVHTYSRLSAQIREQMCLETHLIYDMKILSWAVLGSRAAEKKKYLNCHK